MTFFDCTADLVGQLNRNGQKGMLQIDAPPVKKFLAMPLGLWWSGLLSWARTIFPVNIAFYFLPVNLLSSLTLVTGIQSKSRLLAVYVTN